MENLSKEIEVLAPAGTLESLFVAVNNGADAVYLGINELNARANLANFDLEKLKEGVDYVHLFGVKVYLAINILIKNSEINEAIKIAKKAYMLGIDAFIVQDLGLFLELRKQIPDAIFHASTQMGIHNLEGAKFIESLGFKRVILARETPISEIKRIKDGTNLEIEYFVQGAICVSFSGNCYLCSIFHKKSGNRGKCLQLCRLPYSLNALNNQKSGYLLSTKDNCMISKLKDLILAGVTSLKIEGRARRPAYVAETVRCYKEALNNLSKNADMLVFRLKKVFNRGDFTPGYLSGNKIIYPIIQGHIGVKIGLVEKVNKGKRFNEIIISSSHKIIKGDGIKFILNGKEVGSIGCDDVKFENNKYIITTKKDIPSKCDVHLILDYKREEKLLSEKRKLKINVKFEAKIAKKACILLDFKNFNVKIYSENLVEKALTEPTSQQEIFNQINKLNDQPFEIENFSCNIDDVFLPKSLINEMRRKAIKELKEAILAKYKIRKIEENELKIVKNEQIFDPKTIYKVDDFEKLSKINGAYGVIFAPKDFVKEEIKTFAELCKAKNIIPFLDLPVFATNRDICLILDILNDFKELKIVANNYYALSLKEPKDILIGSNLNIFNNFSLKFYEQKGFFGQIVSIELNEDEQNELKSPQSFAFCKGRYDLMVLKHCPFIEFFNSNCKNCLYKEGGIYTMHDGKKLLLERRKMTSCQFILKSFDKFDIEKSTKLNKIIEIF